MILALSRQDAERLALAQVGGTVTMILDPLSQTTGPSGPLAGGTASGPITADQLFGAGAAAGTGGTTTSKGGK